MSYVVRKCAVGSCKNILYPPPHQKHWALQCDECIDKLHKRMEKIP